MKKHLLKWGKSGNITKVSEVLRKQPPLPKNVILGKILGSRKPGHVYKASATKAYMGNLGMCYPVINILQHAAN